MRGVGEERERERNPLPQKLSSKNCSYLGFTVVLLLQPNCSLNTNEHIYIYLNHSKCLKNEMDPLNQEFSKSEKPVLFHSHIKLLWFLRAMAQGKYSQMQILLSYIVFS